MSSFDSLDFSQLYGAGERLLITTDDWFSAADGQKYRSAWGTCRVLRAKDILGFDPKQSTNWVMQVGTADNCLFVLGCRIHYVQLCPDRPLGTEVLCLEDA